MVNLTQSTVSGSNWEELWNCCWRLQEYGGLIGLLNAQQQSILNRKPESLVEINQSVQTQMEGAEFYKNVSRICISFGSKFRQIGAINLNRVVASHA